MHRRAYRIGCFLLAAVLLVAIAACGKRDQKADTSTGIENADEDRTADDIDGKADTPEGTDPEDSEDSSGEAENGQDSVQEPEEQARNEGAEGGEGTDSTEDGSGTDSSEPVDGTGKDEAAPKDADNKAENKSPERIGIYTIDDETLETVSLTALIDTTDGLKPEAVVEAVKLALEDQLIEFQIGGITVDGKKITVDFQAEDAKQPFGNAGASVEGVVLDCITYSLFDNFREIKEIYFTVNGGAYESGHISLAVGEAYQTK